MSLFLFILAAVCCVGLIVNCGADLLYCMKTKRRINNGHIKSLF